MSSTVPIIRQGQWLGYAILLAIYFALVGVLALAEIADPGLWAIFIFISLMLILRNLVARSHRLGMGLVRKEQWDEALPHFEESYAFFSRRPWVDRWKVITMLSPSSMDYREMALVNQAFCHGQLGHADAARLLYQSALAEYPTSKIAQTALRLIETKGDNAPDPSE